MIDETRSGLNIEIDNLLLNFIKEKYYFFEQDEAISRFVQIVLYDLFMDLQPLDIKLPVLKDDPLAVFSLTKLVLSKDLVKSITSIFNKSYSHSFDRFQLEIRKQLYLRHKQYNEIVMKSKKSDHLSEIVKPTDAKIQDHIRTTPAEL